MLRGVTSNNIINYGLGFLYGFSVVVYGGMLGDTPFRSHAFVLAVLFLVLFICSVAVIRLQEWGRRLLVVINGVMCFYLLGLWGKYADFIQPSYIFLNIAVVLFFSQRGVKAHFQSELALTRKSILVIDDDESLLKTIKKFLLSQGYSVLVATTGEKGLQVAKTQQPDLVVLDVILPGIKGRQVCTILKKDNKTKNIPVIFLTAKDSTDDIKAELEAGGDTHLTKPFDAKALLAEIKKHLN